MLINEYVPIILLRLNFFFKSWCDSFVILSKKKKKKIVD